jgi:hypothetical protein
VEAIESLIQSVRGSFAPDATEDARRAGAHACRTLLAALDAKHGEALVPAPVLPAPSNGVQAIVSLLRSAPPDQLLDLAIAKLRTLVPPAEQATVRAFPIRIVPVRKP